ncbi:MAG: hypothetical protein G01um101449_206 [Parcubacteria group bacterium Gr01-1014_49]|nr:MAG: hypothetical protein G01um101449_206 [Parcubacteria group bacterium Gr01-1014_49]
MDRKRPVPVEVKQAMLRGDREALSKLGHIGAEHAAILRSLDKRGDLEAELERAKLAEVSKEGDILPPDPQHIEALEAVLKD